jgi:1,4-alpha-glucan branching enzyme
MLFMGQEAGEDLQFGQDDGRVEAATAPTWWDDRLPLAAYETDPDRSKVRLWWRRMLDIRRGDLGRLAWGDVTLTHSNDANGIVAFSRDEGKYVVVLNFKGGSWEYYDVGVRGKYQELANTSWPAFKPRTQSRSTGRNMTVLSSSLSSRRRNAPAISVQMCGIDEKAFARIGRTARPR